MQFLTTAVALLAAAVVAVPLGKRLGLGSVLGYLLAGIAVGPVVGGLVTDVGAILQISQVGVVMLLFIIGLELRPARLWTMRRVVLGFGGAQVAASTLLLAAGLLAFGFGPAAALVGGFGLALSSTAMALPMLAEHQLLEHRLGRDAFAVLLFQDLVIIPVFALLPLLTPMSGAHSPNGGGLLVLVLLLVAGPLVIRPLFRLLDQLKLPEVHTASALLLVVGAATVAEHAGLSPSLGAFAAGVTLSGSEYRHELQADIEPFKGLLLGLFFMGVGMALDPGPLLAAPLAVLGLTLLIIIGKLLVLWPLARLISHRWVDAGRMAIMLAQGGEFAFVLFGLAGGAELAPAADWGLLSLAVTLSMLATPPLYALYCALANRLAAPPPEPDYDDLSEASPVIICGFGRFGQVVGRILRSRGIRFTALESDAGQVDFVRRFGNKVFYGDPARLELLRGAGAEQAKVMVVALADVEQSLRVVELVRRHFPHLSLFVRARNRLHTFRLMDMGVRNIMRETLHSSLQLSGQVLEALGDDAATAAATLRTFEEHDRQILADQHVVHTDEKKLIQTSREAAEELRGLFESDERFR